jgi:hypothetical protein
LPGKTVKEKYIPSANPAPETALEAFMAAARVAYNGWTVINDYATFLIHSRSFPGKLLVDHWRV